jgi:predicted transcriptional regulator of viral defense system
MKRKAMAHKAISERPTPRDTLSKLSRHVVGGVVTIDEAASLLAVSRRDASLRLAALARRGWLARLYRGTYYVLPLESGPAETAVAADPWVLALRLFSPCYVGGWSAAEHWGLTEQLFRSTFVVTGANIRKRSVRILGSEFQLVRVLPEQLSGIASVWRGAVRVPTSDPERTIADALIDPTWIGGVRHLVDIILTSAADRKATFPKILAHLERTGRAAGIKRLGFLLESLFPAETDMISMAHARRSSGIIRLDPSVQGKGRLSKRWGLWVNVSLPGPRGS